MLWLNHVRADTEISKKLTLNPTMSVKNTSLFLLPDMGLLLKIFALEIPLHADVFSFTNNAVVLPQFTCVLPENQTNFFFDFNIFMNQNKCFLHKTWSACKNKVVDYKYSLLPALNWFVTLNCKLLSHWAIVKNMAVSDLAFLLLYIYGTTKAWYSKDCITAKSILVPWLVHWMSRDISYLLYSMIIVICRAIWFHLPCIFGPMRFVFMVLKYAARCMSCLSTVVSA